MYRQLCGRKSRTKSAKGSLVTGSTITNIFVPVCQVPDRRSHAQLAIIAARDPRELRLSQERQCEEDRGANFESSPMDDVDGGVGGHAPDRHPLFMGRFHGAPGGAPALEFDDDHV